MPSEVYVTRGEVVEAVHQVSVAVVNSDGELTHYLGDPDAVYMTRSSIKPFQLLPTLISGTADKFSYTPRQLAIMCGSHNGTDEHRELVLSNLRAADNAPEMLQCGSHRPIWMEQENIFPKAGEETDPVRHNCSGKHSGFLALARTLGDPVESYLDPNSTTQILVRETVSEYCEYPLEKVFYGTDGCSAPNFPLPLSKLATAFGRLAAGKGVGSIKGEFVMRIRDAMFEYPKMVSGEGRIDYELARTLPGNLICKIGAEAIEGIGLMKEGIGIAVKVHDGNFRALEPVLVEVLRQLGVLSKRDEDLPYLKKFIRPSVYNVRGIPTGEIIPDFRLITA